MNTNKDMKLILESWRGYVEKVGVSDLGTIHLFENNKKTSSMSFEDLLGDHGNGVINEKQFLQIWEQSTLHDYNLLLQEGVMDALSDAFEKAKDGAIKLKDTISDVAAAALKKVQSFVVRVLSRLAEMVTKGFSATVKAAQFVWGKVKSLHSKHPVIFWVATAVILAAVTAAVYAQLVDPDTAQIIAQCAGSAMTEDVQCTSGQILGQSGYEAARGLLSDMAEMAKERGEDPVSVHIRTIEAINLLDAANANPADINLGELGTEASKMAQAAANTVQGTIDAAKEAYSAGDEETARELYGQLDQVKDIGKKMVIMVKDNIPQGPTTKGAGL